MFFMINLPIDSHLPQILRTLESSQNFVLVASPGSGKTTRLPPALLGCAWRKEKEIIVLEPRRLAAKLAALRVAEEMDQEIGKTVGYHFRSESQSGPETKLRFYTEGILLRRMIGEPSLDSVAAVVLDEFHERHFHADMALSLLRHLQSIKRPDLKIILMSATLDQNKMAQFLGQCPTLNLEIPAHPIEYFYNNSTSRDPLEKQIVASFRQTLREKSNLIRQNNTLIFLPGRKEIERTRTSFLDAGFDQEFEILPLYGDLSKEQQNLVFQNLKKPKIILSTNLAESSVTLPQIRFVIDAGLRREADFSPWSGLPILRTKPATKASLVQRAGRAGRLGPGVCFRLFSKLDFEGRPAFDNPEITRIEFAPSLLELHALGIQKVADLQWLDSPTKMQIEKATDLLTLLGAIDEKGSLTDVGSALALSSAHPRWSKALYVAKKKGVAEELAHVAIVAAKKATKISSVSDALHFELRSKEEIFEKKRFLQVCSKWQVSNEESKDSIESKVSQSLLSGFVDLVGKLRPDQKTLTLATGGSCRTEGLHLESGKEFYLVLDAHSDYASAITPIEPDWILSLSPCPIEEVQALTWDERLQRLSQKSALALKQINLTEDSAVPKASPETFSYLLKNVLKLNPTKYSDLSLADQWETLKRDFSRFFAPEQLEQLGLYLGRVLFWAQATQEKNILAKLEKNILEFLIPAFKNCISLKEIQSISWPEYIIGHLTHDQIQFLQTRVPEKWELAKGRRTLIHYNLTNAPWIESRLQDFFGIKETPQILSKKITVHLLAPNGRALQVTQDLNSFWKNTYPEVRKELVRRYPKHNWPEY
ncbi:MAG: ATP-dependent helicase HrpB [Pseudobdellovibrionaceae bacterium]